CARRLDGTAFDYW
nr:immunoglobulin heavy chain junction region [Macaca mulatta]MOV43852.1 immunoglobulin heavy chain junction region [Macaca mulatta]MOV44028.1 immunoglobulin heavy chain junction region [Macaca mulatta]